ncbi:MAG: cupin domain-containing protein [Dongiaceae bacterium]
MDPINLAAALAAAPRNGLAAIATVNDTVIKAGRFEGRFAWHRHAAEDELFWVIRGRLTIQLRDRDVALAAGEMFVVPAGVEHRSVATAKSEVVVIHPRSTVLPGTASPVA